MGTYLGGNNKELKTCMEHTILQTCVQFNGTYTLLLWSVSLSDGGTAVALGLLDLSHTHSIIMSDITKPIESSTLHGNPMTYFTF